MRLLLLGATGFLGRHVAEAARASEAVDLLSHARRGSDASSDVLVVDLLAVSGAQLRHLIASVAPDAIVNAVGATIGDAASLQAANVRLVARLLDAVAVAAPQARIIQLGSAAEYGAIAGCEPIAEDAEPRPVSPYGESKLAATRLLAAAAQDGVPAIVLRVFNPIGRWMRPETLAGTAVAQLRAVRAGRASELRLGPLDDHRDFIDARDIADAVLAAAVLRGPLPSIINVGSGRAVQARELVRRLASVAGFDGPVVEAASVPGRSAAVAWQEADITRARSALDWHPRRSLDDALRALWTADAAR